MMHYIKHKHYRMLNNQNTLKDYCIEFTFGNIMVLSATAARSKSKICTVMLSCTFSRLFASFLNSFFTDSVVDRLSANALLININNYQNWFLGCRVVEFLLEQGEKVMMIMMERRCIQFKN